MAVPAHLQTAGHFAQREGMMNQHLSPAVSPHAPRLADLLIRAAAIYSMAQDRAVYRAIAIRDEWIVAVSQDPQGLDGVIGADTHGLDAPELAIPPAFQENHNHLMFASQNMGPGPAVPGPTLAEILAL